MCPFTEHSLAQGLEDLDPLGQHNHALRHLAKQAEEGTRATLRKQLFSVPDVRS